MLLLILSYVPSLLCGLHAVQTGRAQTWLWILVIGGPLGATIYIFAVLVPEWMGGRTARNLGAAARAALDPERDYRQAKQALEDAETVGGRMRLAQAAAALGRWEEAEAAWAQCVTGQFTDDPVVLLGHANALIELGRFDEALKRLQALSQLGQENDTAPVALAYARTFEGLGRTAEAEAPYRFAAERLPGLEAACRYAAFLARAGRGDDARAALADIERRFAKVNRQLKGIDRPWVDMATRAVGAARP
ncbi:MAG: hypothetical protein NW200_11610 [Hyphomonadaceae bacterium]|nr:hypothetical protein [Hyphomonadaceae bacterium]